MKLAFAGITAASGLATDIQGMVQTDKEKLDQISAALLPDLKNAKWRQDDLTFLKMDAIKTDYDLKG